MKVGIIVSSFFCLMVHAEEFSEVKGKCEKVLHSIEVECVKAKKDALVLYGRNLDSYMAHLKKKGKLDDYLALEKEKARFGSEKMVPPKKGRKNFVRKIAARYDVAVAKAEAGKTRKIIWLMKKYVARLDDLMKSLMQDNRMSDAKGVQNEIERCKFILDDFASRNPKPKVSKPLKPKIIPKLSGRGLKRKYIPARRRLGN